MGGLDGNTAWTARTVKQLVRYDGKMTDLEAVLADQRRKHSDARAALGEAGGSLRTSTRTKVGA